MAMPRRGGNWRRPGGPANSGWGMESIERYRGCLLGLAVGDALGAPLESRSPGRFRPLDDMVGGGPFRVKAGMWTDDTSMALCLAESLVERRGFDPVDQLERYLRWYREGYMSSKRRSFGIGRTVRRALRRFRRTGEPWCGPTHPMSAGNGSLMRLAPVAMFFAERPVEAVLRAGESSRTTHGAREAVDACRYLGALLTGALSGVSREALLSDRFEPVPGIWSREPLAPRIDEVAAGSFKRRSPPDIRGGGYVVESLEAALWAFHRSASFREGALLAVNLGDDADTTAAVYGQLAGAVCGDHAIPAEWRSKVVHREMIEALAEKLYARRAV